MSETEEDKYEIDDYNLRVYGTFGFEPVLIDLLNSSAMQRLRHIQQHGPDVMVWEHSNITRFEHSLGVLLLLKRLGAPLEDQVVGLIHDVSHAAFSHAADFVFGRELSADFGDRAMRKIVSGSEIPKIIERYGLGDIERLIDFDNFPLVKKKLPDICADRIDYLCRDMERYGLIDFGEIDAIINDLIVYKNEIIFRSFDPALLFGNKFIEAGEKVFAKEQTIFFHTMIAEAIKIGLSDGILTEDDLFGTDEYVKEKLLASHNHEIMKRMGLISSKTVLIPVEKNSVDVDFNLKVKIRIPDPKILINGSPIRLSAVDAVFRTDMHQAISSQRDGHFVKIFHPEIVWK